MKARDLFLREDFRALWAGQDPFAAAFAVEGETFRALEQRQTLAFNVQGRRYFIKRHRGITWKEILKNLVQLRLPVVSASNEYRAIGSLQALGIHTPVVAAYGKRGWLPASFESFLVTEDVGPHCSLEDYCRPWQQHPPAFAGKLALLLQLAAISRTMHAAGICHRDYYLCHFLRSDTSGALTLIDLHRALVKPSLGQRWIIKDLGGLYFSAMQVGLTERDLLRFMRAYSGRSLRETLRNDEFWSRVREKAQRLHNRH